jgi:hypothetical protein
MGEVIEHVARPDLLMARVLELVKPGGALVCTTPNGACFRNSDLPSYAEASKDLEGLAARQFGPAGEDHLFAIRPDELIDLAPGGARPELLYLVSGLWGRPLGLLARSRTISRLVEWVSRRRVWRRTLCDTLLIVVRRGE